jgi:hypothetical protein
MAGEAFLIFLNDKNEVKYAMAGGKMTEKETANGTKFQLFMKSMVNKAVASSTMKFFLTSKAIRK